MLIANDSGVYIFIFITFTLFNTTSNECFVLSVTMILNCLSDAVEKMVKVNNMLFHYSPNTSVILHA